MVVRRNVNIYAVLQLSPGDFLETETSPLKARGGLLAKLKAAHAEYVGKKVGVGHVVMPVNVPATLRKFRRIGEHRW